MGENQSKPADKPTRQRQGDGHLLRPFPLSPAAVNQHRQTPADDTSEFMIMGLRLTREGVSLSRFRERFGHDPMEVYGREIRELLQLGLLEAAEHESSETLGASEVVRLTRRGRLLGNQVFIRFV